MKLQTCIACRSLQCFFDTLNCCLRHFAVIAQDMHLDIVLVQLRELAADKFDQEVEYAADLLLRALPVFGGKRVDRQVTNPPSPSTGAASSRRSP